VSDTRAELCLLPFEIAKTTKATEAAAQANSTQTMPTRNESFIVHMITFCFTMLFNVDEMFAPCYMICLHHASTSALFIFLSA
jgi:hypothetical protein